MTRLVALGTLALAAAAVGYVLRFGSDVPNTDEWDYVARVVGPFPVGWLIEHHNEHRYPLARLLWLGSVRLAGDFRAPMLLTVALLTATSLLLTTAARRWRGTASVGDLLVPALLLHWGHAFNFLMGYQVAFGLYALGLAGVVWAVTADRPHLGGLFAAVAVQSGGFGLAVAAPLAFWLGWEARRRPTVVLWSLAIIAYSGWITLTLPVFARPPEIDPVDGVVADLAIGLGLWVAPLGRAAWWAAALAVGGWCILAATVARRNPGFLAVLAAHGLATVAVGYGRGDWAIGDRFVTPSAVGLAIAWVLLGRRGRWIGLPLAVLVVGLNTGPGYRYGKLSREQNKTFLADLQNGLPPVFLSGKYGGGLTFLTTDGLVAGITGLRDGGWRRFRDAAHDPPFTPTPVAGFQPVRLACGNDPFVPDGPPPPAIPLPPSPGPVVGLRARGEQHFPMGYQVLRLRWTDMAGVAHTAEATPKVVPGRFTVAFPIGGPAVDVRLEAATPMLGLDVAEIEWLIPG